MLKHFLWTFAAALSLLVAGPAAAQKKDDGFQTSVPHAILIEAESGSVLYERAADDLVYPASLCQADDRRIRVQRIATGQYHARG